MNRSHLRVALGQFITDRSGGIAATVVNQDNFPSFRQLREHDSGGFHCMSNIGFFVESWKNYRERDTGDRLSHSGTLATIIRFTIVTHRQKTRFLELMAFRSFCIEFFSSRRLLQRVRCLGSINHAAISERSATRISPAVLPQGEQHFFTKRTFRLAL